MDIRNKVGKISLDVEIEEANVHIEFGGIETEMVGLSPIEYVQILKAKTEISQLSKQAITNIVDGIRGAFDGPNPHNPIPHNPMQSAADIEELLKQLPFMKGAKVIKVDPKDFFGNPGGLS